MFVLNSAVFKWIWILAAL